MLKSPTEFNSSDFTLNGNIDRPIGPPPPLSPDSRPIRPLHSTQADPYPQSPPHMRHGGKSTSSLCAQESYPHSLMDRPITTRLAKRLSSGEKGHEFDEVPCRKSNIAYTLTFHDEPICVNLRTKSQSVTPEPSQGVLDSSPDIRRTSDSSAAKSPQAAHVERQLSLPNDRETSPGYRQTYEQTSLRSPTAPRKSLGKKNPKVTREKDRLAQKSPSLSHEELSPPGDDPSNPVENGHTSPSMPREEQPTKIEVKVAKEIKMEVVHSIHAVNTVEKANGISLEEQPSEDPPATNGEGEVVEKPACRLQRRNTFTLSTNGGKKNGTADNGHDDEETATETDVVKFVVDESIQKDVILSVCSSPTHEQQPYGENTVTSPIAKSPSSGEYKKKKNI